MILRYFFLIFLVLFGSGLYGQTSGDSTSTKTKPKLIFLPVVYNSPETRLALGAASSFTFKVKSSKLDTLLRTSSIQLLGLRTLRKQTITGLDGTIYFPHETYILRFHGSFTDYPDKFWGLGNTPLNQKPESFSYSQFYIFPQLLRKVHSHFFAGVSFEVQRLMKFHYHHGGLFDADQIIGMRTSNINGAGMIALWDSRNNAFSSTKGSFVEFTANTFNSFLGSSFQYANYTIDARKYFLIRKKDVLAFQACGNFNVGRVPFLSLAAMGGSSLMRGYYSGRFRDKNLAVLQSEYRMQVTRKFGVVGFVGVGEVTRMVHQVVSIDIDARSGKGQLPSITKTNDYRVAGGWGLRYALRESERLNLRLDFGYAKDSKGIYITVAEAF